MDYLIDDVRNMSSIPLEVKSGKDYTTHSALERFVANRDYAIRQACVLSNGSKVFEKDGITYFPIYILMISTMILTCLRKIIYSDNHFNSANRFNYLICCL